MKHLCIIGIISIALLASCTTAPRAIREGEDACAYCKMTVSDKRYASEVITATGKIYVFDDMHCMRNFIAESQSTSEEIKNIYVSNFYDPDHLIPADDALLFTSESLHTPMNGKTIALADSGALERIQQEMQGSTGSIHDLLK